MGFLAFRGQVSVLSLIHFNLGVLTKPPSDLSQILPTCDVSHRISLEFPIDEHLWNQKNWSHSKGVQL